MSTYVPDTVSGCLWHAGELTAKAVRKFVTASFPARTARIDAASLQPFLAMEPQVSP